MYVLLRLMRLTDSCDCVQEIKDYKDLFLLWKRDMKYLQQHENRYNKTIFLVLHVRNL